MLNPNLKSVVPAPLLDTPNWVLWKLETRHGKPTKVPYQAIPVEGDPKARSNDPSTWAEFCDAWAESLENDKYSGIGFMLVGSKYTGVDFDGVVTEGVVEPYVVSIIKIAGNPYAEITPSGDGVRIFLERTKLPNGKRKFTVTDPKKYGAEIYSGAETGRYLTVTGNKIEGSGYSIPVMNEWGLELVYVLAANVQLLLDALNKRNQLGWSLAASFPALVRIAEEFLKEQGVVVEKEKKEPDGFQRGLVDPQAAIDRVVAARYKEIPKGASDPNLLQAALGNVPLDEKSVGQLWLAFGYWFKETFGGAPAKGSNVMPEPARWIMACIVDTQILVT